MIMQSGKVWNFWSSQKPRSASTKITLPKLSNLPNKTKSGRLFFRFFSTMQVGDAKN